MAGGLTSRVPTRLATLACASVTPRSARPASRKSNSLRRSAIRLPGIRSKAPASGASGLSGLSGGDRIPLVPVNWNSSARVPRPFEVEGGRAALEEPADGDVVLELRRRGVQGGRVVSVIAWADSVRAVRSSCRSTTQYETVGQIM
ncbi:hypothetical protein AQJ64_35500 [Streptomyces griseoruber]|uniref:Uncharacterized protein n=1 Tax=Streptomyces griseoruber TaxID=1943 RepID=A0A101SN44_9ACTN|nr:hypothetical protein AQJ64_35500 [Streptomyces griseoruber]